MKKKEVAKLVSDLIKREFPTSPEGQLMFAVLRHTILDLALKDNAKNREAILDAQLYFKMDMFHCHLCGVDPDWIIDVLIRAKLLPDNDVFR